MDKLWTWTYSGQSLDSTPASMFKHCPNSVQMENKSWWHYLDILWLWKKIGLMFTIIQTARSQFQTSTSTKDQWLINAAIWACQASQVTISNINKTSTSTKDQWLINTAIWAWWARSQFQTSTKHQHQRFIQCVDIGFFPHLCQIDELLMDWFSDDF